MNDARTAQKLEKLQAMLVALGDGSRNIGPIFQIIPNLRDSHRSWRSVAAQPPRHERRESRRFGILLFD